MFRNGSPYSPFFTSGLLSTAAYPHPPLSAPLPSDESILGQRRGSLPTDSTTVDEDASIAKATDQSSAFYVTLQPKRDTRELRSFLSLDLAESQSLRSASLRRKFSGPAKQIPQPLSPVLERRSEDKPRTPSPIRSRHSRESLRTLPSPKPAPSITLPELPKQAPASPAPSLPPRLPSITINPSLRLSTVSTASSTDSPIAATTRTSAPDAMRPLPRRTPTTYTSSTVSTRTRGINRSDALARLEGRIPPKRFSPLRRRGTFRSNFINLSDEESDVEDDYVMIAALEPEDIVLPPPPMPRKFSNSLSSRSPRRRREQRSSYKDMWAPDSFIDLHDDNVSGAWNWRSFIEIASIS